MSFDAQIDSGLVTEGALKLPRALVSPHHPLSTHLCDAPGSPPRIPAPAVEWAVFQGINSFWCRKWYLEPQSEHCVHHTGCHCLFGKQLGNRICTCVYTFTCMLVSASVCWKLSLCQYLNSCWAHRVYSSFTFSIFITSSYLQYITYLVSLLCVTDVLILVAIGLVGISPSSRLPHCSACRILNPLLGLMTEETKITFTL